MEARLSLEYRSGTVINNIPSERQQQYTEWANALEQNFPGAEAHMRDKLNAHVDEWLRQMDAQGIRKPQFCSSWIPGDDWRKGDAVFQPIYETMMRLYGQDHNLAHKMAGWFFGLLLVDVMIHREDDHWECWHERGEDSFDGMFYRPLQAV
jgi:hypothetical protein